MPIPLEEPEGLHINSISTNRDADVFGLYSAKHVVLVLDSLLEGTIPATHNTKCSALWSINSIPSCLKFASVF